MSDEPARLPPELDELVRGMRADRLGADELAEVARRLGPPLGSGGGGAGGAFLPRVAIAGGALVVILALGVVWLTWPTERAVAPVAQRSVSAEEPAREGPTAPIEAARVTARDLEVASEASPTERARPPEAARVRRAMTEPALEEEHPMLVEARRVLPVDASAALALADQHRARFPSGVLAPEREMIAIEALESLGRRGDAEERARGLVERWPRSAYARRVRARGLVP